MIVLRALNWFFLFISDDFVMSANYVAHRRVAPPTLDAIKIALGSLATVATFLVVLFQEFDRRVAWAALAFAVLMFLIMLYRAAKPVLAAGSSTFGILPDEDDWRPDADEEVLTSSIRTLREQGVLTEAEMEDKLRLVPLLYTHGVRAHEILAADQKIPGQHPPGAHEGGAASHPLA